MALLSRTMRTGLTSKRTLLAGASTVVLAVAGMRAVSGFGGNVPDTVKTTDVGSAPMIPLDFAVGVMQGDRIDGNAAIQSNLQQYGALAFVVRRPGWVLCREHGQQLTQLAAESPMEGFGLFGVVKEVGVDDEGLREFHEKFFSYPLYLDVEKSMYAALGNRGLFSTISTYNPFKFYKNLKDTLKRMEKKGIEGNMAGEGYRTGGVILYNADGKPVYACPEETGSELNLDEIRKALESARKAAALDNNQSEL